MGVVRFVVYAPRRWKSFKAGGAQGARRPEGLAPRALYVGAPVLALMGFALALSEIARNVEQVIGARFITAKRYGLRAERRDISEAIIHMRRAIER